MEPTILHILTFTQDILLVLYERQGKKHLAFALKAGFQAEFFVPAPEPDPAQMSVTEFTCAEDIWQGFQTVCAGLEVTPEDCIRAFLRFMIQPASYTAVERLLCGKDRPLVWE